MNVVRAFGLFCLFLAPFLAWTNTPGPCSAPAVSFAGTVEAPCLPDPEDLFSAEEMALWQEDHRQKRRFHYFRVGSILTFYFIFFSLGLNRRLKAAADRWTTRLYEHPGLARLGRRWPLLSALRRIPEGLYGDRQWLTVLLYALGFVFLLRLLFFPYSFYRTYWFDLQTGLSNYTLGLWFLDYGKGLILHTLRYSLMVFGIYGLLVRAGRHWWVFLWAGVTLAIFVWVYIVPYRQMVFNEFRPLEEGEVRTRLENLAQEQDLPLEDIYVVDASKRTKKVNAYVTGKGATRRIILYDNLVENFTPREIAMVMAHEFVHWKEPEKKSQYLVFSLTVFGVLFLASRILIWGSRVRFFHYDGPSDVAGLPLLLLTFSLIFMFIRPVNLYVKRSRELETDRKSLVMLCDPEAFVQAHTKLARLNHKEIDPHPLVVYLFYSHPPFLQRAAVALCEGCGADPVSREDAPPYGETTQGR